MEFLRLLLEMLLQMALSPQGNFLSELGPQEGDLLPPPERSRGTVLGKVA
jgi:hypothetical protein